MQYKLLSKVFDQARTEGAPNSKNGLATHIHDAMVDLNLNPPTSKSIGTYYEKLETKEDYSISRDILNEFSKYVEYENYGDFIKRNGDKTTNVNRFRFVILILLIVIGFFMYDSSRKKCMRWDGWQYIKVHC